MFEISESAISEQIKTDYQQNKCMFHRHLRIEEGNFEQEIKLKLIKCSFLKDIKVYHHAVCLCSFFQLLKQAVWNTHYAIGGCQKPRVFHLSQSVIATILPAPYLVRWELI